MRRNAFGEDHPLVAEYLNDMARFFSMQVYFLSSHTPGIPHPIMDVFLGDFRTVSGRLNLFSNGV
jgi:hypothetical protein